MEALVRRFALALVLACASVSCASSTPGGYLRVSTFQAELATELAPPGAVSLHTLSAEPFNNITGPQPGFYGHLFGTNLGSDEVGAFYARELSRLGWRVTRPPIRGSGEKAIWGWCKPKMLFRLATLDPHDDRAGLNVADRFSLVIDATVTDGDC